MKIFVLISQTEKHPPMRSTQHNEWKYYKNTKNTNTVSRRFKSQMIRKIFSLKSKKDMLILILKSILIYRNIYVNCTDRKWEIRNRLYQITFEATRVTRVNYCYPCPSVHHFWRGTAWPVVIKIGVQYL